MLALRSTGYHCWECFVFITDLHTKVSLVLEDGSVAPFCGQNCLEAFCAESGMMLA